MSIRLYEVPYGTKFRYKKDTGDIFIKLHSNECINILSSSGMCDFTNYVVVMNVSNNTVGVIPPHKKIVIIED